MGRSSREDNITPAEFGDHLCPFPCRCRCRPMLFLSHRYEVCFIEQLDSLCCARCAGWTACSLGLVIGMPNRWCSGQEGQMAGGGTPQVAVWGVWRSSYPQVDLPAGGIMNPQMDRSSSRGDGIAQRERHRLGRTIYDCCWWSCNLTSLKGLCWCLIAYP